MTVRRRRAGSFRQDFDELIDRLDPDVTRREPPVALDDWEKKRPRKAARCPAFHNKALFEKAGRRD
jgi:hypothetical protein